MSDGAPMIREDLKDKTDGSHGKRKHYNHIFSWQAGDKAASDAAFAKADVTIDAVPTASEIDHALGRLEMAARERSIAVGISSGLPVSIDHIAKWAKTLADHGVQLVPITAVASKAIP